MKYFQKAPELPVYLKECYVSGIARWNWRAEWRMRLYENDGRDLDPKHGNYKNVSLWTCRIFLVDPTGIFLYVCV